MLDTRLYYIVEKYKSKKETSTFRLIDDMEVKCRLIVFSISAAISLVLGSIAMKGPPFGGLGQFRI